MRLILISVLLASGFALQSQDAQVFKDAKNKFSIKYPPDWTLAPAKEGIPFMAVAPDGTANVQVMTDAQNKPADACTYLAKTEASAEGGRTNLVPESKRKTTAEQLKLLGVKDGCIGAYKIMNGSTEVLQGTAVYTAGKKVWILIQTLPTAVTDRHAKGVGDIAKSFTTK